MFISLSQYWLKFGKEIIPWIKTQAAFYPGKTVFPQDL